jgi:hypothetical protein
MCSLLFHLGVVNHVLTLFLWRWHVWAQRWDLGVGHKLRWLKYRFWEFKVGILCENWIGILDLVSYPIFQASRICCYHGQP